MKKECLNKLKKSLPYVLLLIILIIFIYYFINHISEFKKITLVSPILLVLIVIFTILHLLVIGITNNVLLLRHLGIKIKGMDAFGLQVITRLGNYLTPLRGGMFSRAVYLKKKHNFSYTNFFATLSASYIIIFLITCLLGMMCLGIVYLYEGAFSILLFLVLLGLSIFFSSIVIFSPKIKETKSEYINKFIRVINGWHLINRNRKLVFVVGIFSFLQLFTAACSLFLQFMALGIDISFTGAFFVGIVSNLGLIIGFTPANLGISEALIIFSASIFGITIAESLSVALLGRAISFLTVAILGPIFSYYLIKKN